jgi:hypothetical protein
MRVNDHSLRDSIVQSLKAEPLLVEVEEVLHSFDVTTASQDLRQGLLLSLETAPLQAEVDDVPYKDIERENVQKLRTALEAALKTGASVTDAEREVLKSIGFEKLGEFRSRVQTHLGGPAEIPDEDLAIYVPAGEGRRESFKEAIEEQIRELEIEPEMPIEEEEPSLREQVTALLQHEIAELPPEEEALAPWEPFVPQEPKEEEVLAQASVEVTVPVEETIGISAAEAGEVLTGLNPVPMLTAALEATGVDGADFGFLLRYGRYAPEGRKSEFLIGGMGMAELSDRLAAWLKANGPMDAQVQVVDEGSGELMIYLLSKEI